MEPGVRELHLFAGAPVKLDCFRAFRSIRATFKSFVISEFAIAVVRASPAIPPPTTTTS